MSDLDLLEQLDQAVAELDNMHRQIGAARGALRVIRDSFRYGHRDEAETIALICTTWPAPPPAKDWRAEIARECSQEAYRRNRHKPKTVELSVVDDEFVGATE